MLNTSRWPYLGTSTGQTVPISACLHWLSDLCCVVSTLRDINQAEIQSGQRYLSHELPAAATRGDEVILQVTAEKQGNNSVWGNAPAFAPFWTLLWSVSMSRREHCPRPGGHGGYLGGKTQTHNSIFGHLETRHEQHGDVLFIKFMSQTSCYVVAPFKFCPLPSWGHLQSPDAYFRRWRQSSVEL